MTISENINQAYDMALSKNDKLWEEIRKNPQKFRILTGERPTGALHIGHYFGTLENRLRLQDMGIDLWVIIADYQVITDRDASALIKENVLEVLADYISIGIDSNNPKTTIFAHSYIQALNQLMLPFLSLVPQGDLNRNPTVKSEIQSMGLKSVNALMHSYPVHQAADILFCHGNLVPGGKDQLPHIELTREIARRFNEHYSKNTPFFPEPQILLSEAPLLLGLDGRKMGKSLNNAIYLKYTSDETAKVIKKAVTDSDRHITYDPVNRPEVSNLLLISSLCSKESPEDIAKRIGDGGSGMLKNITTEAINEYFRESRQKRIELLKDKPQLISILKAGNERAQEVANQTLDRVRSLMGMDVY